MNRDANRKALESARSKLSASELLVLALRDARRSAPANDNARNDRKVVRHG